MNRSHIRIAGFTLLEVMLSMTILSFVGLLTFVVARTSVETTRLTEARGAAYSNVREALVAISSEIEMAVKEDPAMGVQVLGVYQNGLLQGTGQPGNGFRFRVPEDESGILFSSPIMYVFRSEDANGNGVLDGASEDQNSNGVLDRRIFRQQDLNGDGDWADANEETIVVGINDLDTVQFQLNAARDLVTIDVTSSKAIGGTRGLNTAQGAISPRLARSGGSTLVYLLN